MPGFGGVVEFPTLSRRFGDPVPGLVTTFGVAALTRAVATWAGVAVGLAARWSAAAPTTCGVAIEVPEMVFVAVSPVPQEEVMLEPGANRSRTVP